MQIYSRMGQGSTPSTSPAGTPWRVLVVDDDCAGDPAGLAGLAGEVASDGARDGPIEVTRARTLQDALELARRAAPDVVLTGPHPPGGGVPGGTERLHELAPVLALADEGLPPRGLARAISGALAGARLEREVRALRGAELDASEAARRARQEAEVARYEEARATARLSALLELAAALGASSTVEQIAACVTARLRAMTGAETVSVYTIEGETLRLRDSLGLSEEAIAPWRAIPLRARTVISDAARLGVQSQLSTDQILERYGVEVPAGHVWLATPLRGGDQVAGVLGLRFDAALEPAAHVVEYVVLAGTIVAQALQRARLLEAASALEAQRLATLGQELRAPLDALARSAGEDDGPTELAEVVRRQVEELREAHPSREIGAEIARELCAPCDRLRVSQLVSNLVRNALQHGGPRAGVRVSLTRAPVPGATSLIVENQGPPIPEEVRATLFEPFARGARAHGPGLGLYLVRELVASLGGSAIVSSTEELTRFEILLPDPPYP